MSALEAAGTVTHPSRLLAGVRPGRALSLAEHEARHGALGPNVEPGLLEMLEASGLQGRGGAGFPVARKLAAVASGRGRKVVLVNAAEGEPLSRKDKVLLQHTPHLVLDGAVAAAAALGTRDVVVATAASSTSERAALESALAERRAGRVDGSIGITVASIPDGFVAGEETALVHFLNGGRALPTFTPPRVFERGVGGRPTLVLNAETVAQVALIARHGPAWFRQLGTATEPGSALFTLAGAVRRPGVYEAALGTRLSDLLALAGGPSRPPRAFLVGGYFGTWIPAAKSADLTLDEACLGRLGGNLGARAIALLPENACGVVETARIARYLADESAGQCGPCVHGLAAIATALERLARLERGDDRARIARWAQQVTGRGACRHPDGAARFVTSALNVFGDELGLHAVRRTCSVRRPRRART